MKNKYVLIASIAIIVITMGAVSIVKAYQAKNQKTQKNIVESTKCDGSCKDNSNANICNCSGESNCKNFVDKNGDGKCDCEACKDRNAGTCGCSKNKNSNVVKSCGCKK